MKKAIVLEDESPTIFYIDPGEDEWTRCPQFCERINRTCRNKLFRGRPSTEPQEFKCKSCGKTTIFQRIN